MNIVIVGNPSGGNAIATSANGITWKGRTANALSTNGYGVAYGPDGLGGGLWIAVGSGGNTITTSSDGIVWTGKTLNGGLSTEGYSVAYGKDSTGAPVWIAVGSGGNSIVKSSDGGNTWGGMQTNRRY